MPTVVLLYNTHRVGCFITKCCKSDLYINTIPYSLVLLEILCSSDTAYCFFLSQVIKARVKELQVPRFKVIALVTIGSINDQGIVAGSRCLWDASVDTFSSYEFKNKHLFAVGTVYGVYTE